MAHADNMAEDVTKAYEALHQKMLSTVEKIKHIDQQMLAEERRIQFSVLTNENLQELPTIVRTYERFGRMFTLDPRPNVRENLQEKIDTGRKKVQELRTSKEFLERTMKAAEDALRELAGPTDASDDEDVPQQ